MDNIFSRAWRGLRHTVEADPTPGHLTTVPSLVHWLDTTPVESTDRPCTVRSLEVEACVRGIHAEVVQTIKIANPNRRPIATALTVPLPDRAVICGYALEVDGQLVDGVVVPKEEARVIFETEQRRQADPGLVEAVRGNVYNTRVYPVPPHGTRTVRLTYVAPLLLSRDGSATLDLPMPAEHLDRRSMRIAVERLNAPEPIISGLAGASLRQVAHDWSVETSERDLTPTEPVRVELPSLPASFVLLERDVEGGTTWFCASAEAVAQQDAPDNTPLTSLVVLWDASGSRADTDHAEELSLLSTYASAAAIERLTLVTFADRVREVCSFASANDLVRHVRELHYDGGTDFGALSRCEALQGEVQRGIVGGWGCVLFTDGLDTLGTEGFSLPEGLSVLTVVGGTQRDAEAMRQGCRGPVVDISQAPSDTVELAGMLAGAGRFGVGDIVGTGIADVCDVSAPNGSRRAIIGRLTGEVAQLSIGRSGSEMVLHAADAREGHVLSRAWAARRITLLSPRSAENADELLCLGRRFGMASPATSLLVLETLDQWLRYELEPPRTLTTMHRQWTRRMEGRMQLSSEEARMARHRTRLEDAWHSVMGWWGRDYPLPSVRDRSHDASPLSAGNLYHDDWFADAIPMRTESPNVEALRRSSHAAPAMARARTHIRDAYEEAVPTAMADGLFAADDAAPRVHACIADSYDDEDTRDQAPSGPSMSVSVRAWNPNTPYLTALDDAFDAHGPQDLHETYFAQRSAHATSPAFFLDCAGWFMNHGDEDFGVSVLTNLAELRIEDAGLLRVMAWRLRESGRLSEALVALRRVRNLRGEDSQSYRDLALVLAELARTSYAQNDLDAARRYAEEAGELYRKTALTPWERRPLAIALFAVEEYNVLRAWASGVSWETAPELPSLGNALDGVPDCDLRITLAWDADETDVDIHVTEPSGEEAYYAHRRTSSGGRVSEDITDGFGPELYEIRRAREGTYLIRAHYYASHQQTVFGPATCTLTVYTDWGRPNQAQEVTSTRLDNVRRMIEVGTASYGNAPVAERAQDDVHPKRGDASSVEVGMSCEQVEEILGPAEGGEAANPDASLVWRLANGHRVIVSFADRRVVRAVEQMPWGDEMVIAQ